MTPAIAFEPDAYIVEGRQLMGRRAAGGAFIRGLVDAHRGGELTCYSARRASAEAFAAMVGAIDPSVATRWVSAGSPKALAAQGGLYLPDPRLAPMARLRLRTGGDRYFLTGVTHTLSSVGVTQLLADLVTGPVMPWDALICTSRAARAVGDDVIGREADYLSWRIGGRVEVPRPMMPVIPLGIHPDDFAVDGARRAAARARLSIGEDETAFLFAGRLSFHAKAHPFQMLRGLREAQSRSGRRLVLLLAGQFYDEAGERAYRAALADFAPDIRAVVADGADADAYADGWAAADVFVSLSDNVQETFGITPVEAMAAGLPVVVSDWNGYKDTVRDGIDGFRIASWAPEGGSGADAALLHEGEILSFDQQASASSTAISVDAAMLADRLTALAADPGLRARLGAAGRDRARAVFDWRVVIGQYRALWAEQAAVLASGRNDPRWAARTAAAPRDVAPYRDQTTMFARYPTASITAATIVSLRPGANLAVFDALTAHTTLRRWNPPRDMVERWLVELADGSRTPAALAAVAGVAVPRAIDHVARLAKLELVRLDQPEGHSP